MDKIKDKLHIGSHSNTHNTTSTTSGTAEGASGPHGSRTANALDPRVDSDRDNSRTVGGGNTGYGSGAAGAYDTTGGAGAYGTSGGTAEGISGPHGSRVANALDPRVDSDRDRSTTVGNTGYGSAHGGTAGYTTGGTAEGASGPHGSRVANALDPRVDSDRDNSATVGGTGRYGNATGPGNGYGTTTGTNTGFAGGMSSSTNAGPHNSNIANKMDPRVDSDLDGRGNRHGASTGGVFGASGSHATPGSGTAQNTAGPHNSDLANKLDPRVDSDRDNSTTLGGNRTYA
ncbi:hypothetical protein F5884DRAFT_816534 [Xylogone sp. PMI_703]|nr:hypothetical protein F5884DRAFT_816534 [Xylogone sp. PMI_703]